MTALVGLWCDETVIFCADRQFSVPGHHKYHSEKIEALEGPDWKVVTAYSGSPDLMKEVRDRMTKYWTLETAGLDGEAVQASAEQVLEAMGRQYTDLDLQFLIATSTADSLKLLRFDGNSRALRPADKINLLGVGDTSILRFLSKLHSDSMDPRFGLNLGIYLIEKAKEYIDHCGGETDAIAIKKGCRYEWVPEGRVRWLAESMNDIEGECLDKVITRRVHNLQIFQP